MVKHVSITQNSNIWRTILYSLIIVLYLIPLILIFNSGYDSFFQLLRRVAGLTGIVSLFIAILLSLLVRQSRRIFGIAYLRIHHFFSIAGLLLISLHPAIIAIDFGTTRILIPDLSSWDSFLTNAGRSALYIIYIAAIAAIMRRNIAKYWRFLHALVYLAFVLGAVHGMRQGSDLSNPIISILFSTMIATITVIFFYKRVLTGKK